MLLLDGKYQPRDNVGMMFYVPHEDLKTFENRASRFANILGECPYDDHVKISLSIPSYKKDEFLEPFRDIYYKLLESGRGKNPDYIV